VQFSTIPRCRTAALTPNSQPSASSDQPPLSRPPTSLSLPTRAAVPTGARRRGSASPLLTVGLGFCVLLPLGLVPRRRPPGPVPSHSQPRSFDWFSPSPTTSGAWTGLGSAHASFYGWTRGGPCGSSHLVTLRSVSRQASVPPAGFRFFPQLSTLNHQLFSAAVRPAAPSAGPFATLRQKYGGLRAFGRPACPCFPCVCVAMLAPS
jgi:hypothetical protein